MTLASGSGSAREPHQNRTLDSYLFSTIEPQHLTDANKRDD
jgi:hypothetical protein